MRFSLRTLALVIAAMGAFLGIMTKLYLERPEIFQSIVLTLGTIVPFALAVGTVIGLAVRRKPAWSIPICARCSHVLEDLEATSTICPACSADLTQSHAISFIANSRRRWGLLTWGIALLLMPACGYFAAFVIIPSGDPIKALTNQRLIQERFPAGIDQPWVWNELEHRLKQGRLSKQEVNDIVTQFSAHLKATRSAGSNSPLHWQDDFLKEATQRQLIDQTNIINLCDAFYGTKIPTLAVHPRRLLPGQNDFTLQVQFGSPWDLDCLGVELRWEIKEIKIAGQPVKPATQNKTSRNWIAHFQKPQLFTGEHPIEIEVLSAYVPIAKHAQGPAGNIPSAQWPKPIKMWTQTLTAPLHIDPPYGRDLKNP